MKKVTEESLHVSSDGGFSRDQKKKSTIQCCCAPGALTFCPCVLGAHKPRFREQTLLSNRNVKVFESSGQKSLKNSLYNLNGTYRGIGRDREKLALL